MKISPYAFGLLAILLPNLAFACEIVDKRRVHKGAHPGVAGFCSNNGKKIKCYEVGEHQGGLTCSGPQGTNSGYTLEDLVFAVCGCGPQDGNDQLEDQINQELE